MATTDIVTLNETVEYLRANGAVDSPMLAMFITSASATIDDIAGPVVQRTVTGELHDGGQDLIFLRYRPVVSVTTCKEYDRSGTSTTLTAETVSSKPTSGYLLEGLTGIVRRRASGSPTWFAAGERNVEVTYVAGRAASTSAVDARFKLACLVTLAHVWRVELGTGNTFGAPEGFSPSGFAVPNRALEILGHDVQIRAGVA